MTTRSILRIFVIGMVIGLIGVQFLMSDKLNKTAGSIIGAIGVLTELFAIVMLFLPVKKRLDE